MAGSYNKVLLMGNLTRDVELRHTSGNQPVANIGLAVNRRWRTPEGEQREEVTFVDCEAWGKTAETLSKYVSKGRPLFIEGRLKLDQWEKDGQKFSKLKVVVDGFQFIDSKPGGEGGASGGGGDEVGGYSRPAASATRGPGRPTSSGAGTASGGTPARGDGYSQAGGGIGEDDIPF
jgi:single-strand DNA-binding protein